MAYSPFTWQYGDQVSADRLNHIENGIKDAETLIKDTETAVNKSISNTINYVDENYVKQLDVFQTGLKPKFTNVLPLSQDVNGEVQNNLGWTYIIISGAGNETAAANWVSTGYIPVKKGDVLRFENFGLPIGASSYCRIITYKSDHTVGSQGQINTYDATNNSTGMNYIVSPSGGTNTVVLDDAGTNIIQLTICRPGTAAYVRFTVPASGVSSKSIITVNEEIAYEAGYGTKLNGNIQVDSSQIVGDLGQRSPWDILPGAHLAIAYSSIGRMAINTKEHFLDCCKNYGYNVLKCDVRPTSDGELVLCHDAGFTLDANGRITTYNAASSTSIHEMTAAQCVALEHADSKSYGLLGYYAKPCLIGDYLDICRAYGRVAFITIRDEYMDVVVPKLLEELRAHNMMYHTIINSMTYASLVKWRAADSIVCLNYTLGRSANITSAEIDQVVDLGNAMIGGFGFGTVSNESDITCDFTYANERKIRVMNAIGYVSGAYENCIASGYDGLQIGYPWGQAYPDKVLGVADYNDTDSIIKIGYTGNSLTSDDFLYFAGYNKSGNIKDISIDVVNSKVVPQKAIGIADYNNTENVVKIGWNGDSLTSSTLWKLAGYTEDGKIKEASTDAVNQLVVPKKSEGVVDYTDSTKTIQIGWTGDSLSSSEIKYPAAYSTSGNIKDTTWDTFRDKLSLSPRFQLMDGTDLFPTNYELAMNPSSNRAGGSIRYGTWTPSIAKAASYEYRYGSWIKLGNVVTLSFSIKFTAETIPSSTAIQFRILGCPFTPVSQYSAGGGTLSGYYASDNLVFSGYVIDKSDSNAIYAVAQWATAAGYKYTTPCAIGSESQHIASGTIQFISID
mgnify:CR=1 FL=1